MNVYGDASYDALKARLLKSVIGWLAFCIEKRRISDGLFPAIDAYLRFADRPLADD